MKRTILILFLSLSIIACDDKETSSDTPTISKVSFSPAMSAGNAITVFTFTITVPIPGSYTKLALWAEDRNYELNKIENPATGAYSLSDMQLPWDNRIPNKNYFLWTKKDGTTLKQPVTY